MRQRAPKDVKQPPRFGLGAILPGLVIFALTLILLMGDIAWYELRQTNLRLEEELSAREAKRNALSERQSDQDTLEDWAEAMGLGIPDPRQIEILHIRGNTE